MKSTSLKLAGLVVLVILPLFLRVFSIDHGGERNYVPDTHSVRAALGMARDHDLVPPAGKYSNYPNLVPYVLLPTYAVQYELGKLRGEWSDAKSFGDHVLEHPSEAELPARWLVALFGALTCWVVWRTAREAGLRIGAWAAAWLAACGLLHVQFSTQERPWVPLCFFLALAVWPATRYVRAGRGRDLFFSGLAAALSFACHPGGLAAAAIPALAWVFGPLAWNRAGTKQRLAQGIACVLGFAVLAVCVGYPHYLRYGATAKSHVIMQDVIEEQGGVEIGGLGILFQLRPESFVRLSKALFGYDPIVVLLGLAGLWSSLRAKTLRVPALFLIAWGIFFLTNVNDHVRYLLPLALFLCWPAGVACEHIAARFGAWLLAPLLAVPLVQALRFDIVLGREDTRSIAERELAHLPAQSIVAIDRYGPDVDLDRESIERLVRLRNSQKEPLRTREEHRKSLFDRGELPPHAGLNAVRIEELLEINSRTGTVTVRKGLESLGTDPASVLKSMGVTHVMLVERRMSQPNLLAPLVAGREPILVIDPSRPGTHTREAFLPTEMDFPLCGLWSVERPGPKLTLYALR